MKIFVKTLCCFFAALIILSATVASAQETKGQQASDRDATYLSIPGENWALVLNLSGFKIEKRETNKDGKGYRILAYNNSTKVMLSVFLTKEKETGDSKKCRDFYVNRLKTSPIKMEDMKTREVNDIAFFEYMIKEYNGMQVNQKHQNAYLAHGDTWIDIHLSKAMFKAEDQKLFDDFMASVKFKEDYQPSLFDNFFFGMDFFAYRNYEKAAVYLDKALEMEKQENRLLQLDKLVWRTLVEELGLSYTVLGQTAKSLETFEYGLATDPEYAMFYYGRAYNYAKLDDMDKTLENLKMAFKYKSSLAANRKIPNPKTYTGFNKFMADLSFAKEIDQLLSMP